jgi:hypothetical protein
MKEELISFETAKLAKEKGFDNCCYDYFVPNGKLYSNGWGNSIQDNNGFSTNEHNDLFMFSYDDFTKEQKLNYVLRPTQSLLQRWLREVHNCYVEVLWHSPEDGSDVTKENIRFAVEVNYYGKDFKRALTKGADYQEYYFITYETALEKGLIEGLKLIK